MSKSKVFPSWIFSTFKSWFFYVSILGYGGGGGGKFHLLFNPSLIYSPGYHLGWHIGYYLRITNMETPRISPKILPRMASRILSSTSSRIFPRILPRISPRMKPYIAPWIRPTKSPGISCRISPRKTHQNITSWDDQTLFLCRLRRTGLRSALVTKHKQKSSAWNLKPEDKNTRESKPVQFLWWSIF